MDRGELAKADNDEEGTPDAPILHFFALQVPQRVFNPRFGSDLVSQQDYQRNIVCEGDALESIHLIPNRFWWVANDTDFFTLVVSKGL